MADNPQTLALVTLAQNYRGDIVRQINRRSALLRMLPFVKGEGKNCAFATEADGMIAENYADGADATNFGSDAQASAVLSWGLYRSAFRVTGLALASSATSRTPEGNVALWARNMVNASGKLATTVNAGLFTGAGTGTLIAGLDVAVGQTTNTYAGIDRTVGANAYFKPTVVDPGSLTAPTFALVRDDLRLIYEACGENPDLGVCSPAVFNKLGGLFDNTRRQIQDVQTSRGVVKLDAGFGALEIDGTFFVKDKDCQANRIIYLNTNHVRVEYLPAANPSQDMGVMVVGTSDGFGSTPLGMTVEPIAKLGDSSRAQCKTYIQLVVDRPNTCGTRLNVAVT